jgi:hypothetical protein
VGKEMLEKIIKKWWFYITCLMLLFISPLTQQLYPPEQTSLIIQEVMQRPLIYKIKELFPMAKALLLFLLMGALIWKNKFRKIFSILVSFLITFILVFQNISLETKFGYAVLLGNILLQVVVLLSWIYEMKIGSNDFSKPRLRWWNIVLFSLSFISFWMPAMNGGMWFSIKNLFINESGLTYCMVTPVILSILLLYYPKINKVTLRVTSFVGLLFGIINMVTWFILNTNFWWMGVIHLPLLIISYVGLVLSKKI